jgi:O-antigen/teichoic acid export membrane protein
MPQTTFLNKGILKIKTIWAHQGFQKYFRNTGWMFFGNITYLISSFFSVLIIARVLGPENYGQLSYAMSFVALFGFIVGFGTGNILYRELVRNPERKNILLGTSIRINLVSAFIAQILTLVFALLFSDSDVSFWAICILSFSFYFNGYYVINAEFQAEVKAKIPSLLINITHFFIAIIKIIFVLSGKGVIYLATIITLEALFILIGLIYMRIKIYGSIKDWVYDSQIAKYLLKSSWPLIFVSAFSIIYAKIDQIMIKNILNAEAVGLYDSAVRLSELWYFIPTTIVVSMFPAIVNSDKTSSEQFKKRIFRLALFLIIFSVGVAIIVSLFSNILIKTIFGTQFISAVPVLQIYIWSLVASSLSILIHQVLVIKNKIKTIAILTGSGMIINVILNIILIPPYGITGAAWATFVSYWVSVILWVLIRGKNETN